MIRVNRGAFCTLKHVNVFLVDTHCMGALIRISLYVNMFRPITLMPPLRIVLCPRHIKFLWIWTSLCSLACNYKLQSVREVAVFRAAIEWKPFQMQSGCLACATSSPNQRSHASELKKKKARNWEIRGNASFRKMSTAHEYCAQTTGRVQEGLNQHNADIWECVASLSTALWRISSTQKP